MCPTIMNFGGVAVNLAQDIKLPRLLLRIMTALVTIKRNRNLKHIEHNEPLIRERRARKAEEVSRGVLQWGCEGPYSGVYAAPAAVFRLTFLGSVEVDEDTRRRKKRLKKNMVEEAVTKIKVVWLAVFR